MKPPSAKVEDYAIDDKDGWKTHENRKWSYHPAVELWYHGPTDRFYMFTRMATVENPIYKEINPKHDPVMKRLREWKYQQKK